MSPPAPIQSPVGAIEAARRESQQAAYKQLCATLKKLNRLYYVPVLEDWQLQSLGIRKLPDIDVDEHAPFDPEPLFFRPFPIDDEEDVPGFVHSTIHPLSNEVASRQWKKPCVKSDCPGGTIFMGDHCSCKRYQWAYTVAGRCGQGIFGKTQWHLSDCLSGDDAMYLEEKVSDSFYRVGGNVEGVYGDPGFYQLRLGEDMDLDLSKPHIGVAVCDSTRSSRATLASELVAAITLLKFRLRSGDFVNFHTVPAIVYSFHHGESARITQAHWDGKDLVIRHSRLLNLRGDEPTRDAYLLIRWMANKPVGETAYQVPPSIASPESGEKPRPSWATSWDLSVAA